MSRFVYFLMVGLAFAVLQVSTVEAQTGAPGAPMCDSNPACDPTSGTCCDQCDANPACVPGDPNAIPCCGPVDGPPVSTMPTGAPHDPNLRENNREDRQDKRELGREKRQDLQDDRLDRRQDLQKDRQDRRKDMKHMPPTMAPPMGDPNTVSYTHLRAHET